MSSTMSAVLSAARNVTDPLRAYNFRIALIDSSSAGASIASAIGFVVGGFSECTGLEATMQIEDYVEGGENTFVHKFPTRATFGNINLRHGVGLGEDLWNWHNSYVLGKGKRRDGVIILMNDLLMPIKTWTLRRMLPVKWTGPTFNATTSAVAIEALEIAHEGLELFSPGTAVAAAVEAIF